MNRFWLWRRRCRIGRRRTLLLAVSLALILVSSRVFGDTLDNLILSRMGTAEILRYLDAADHQKGLTEEQIAVKYILGEIPQNMDPPSKVVLRWASLPPSEKRNLKVMWFREHYKSVSYEEVNKHVNIQHLKARADAEYRESPLYGAPLTARKVEVSDTPASKAGKKVKVHKKPASPPKEPPKKPVKQMKASGQKKSDTDMLFAGKSKPTPPAPAAASRQDTSGRPGNGVFKKLPWGGIPTRMKND